MANSLLEEDKITEETYRVLFLSKENWAKKYSVLDDKVLHFYDTHLRHFIELQEARESIDLSFVSFIYFESQRFWRDNTIDSKVIFDHCSFYGDTSFENTVFQKRASFSRSKFYSEIIFDYCKFEDDINFNRTTFEENTFFTKCTFYKEADFSNTNFKQIADFSNSKFCTLNLINCYMRISNFNDIKHNNFIINKDAFTNKETPRIIKSHYEKQNNITEANKYFRIEQDLYIRQLMNKDTEPNRFSKLFALLFNKVVSDFGTNWFRALVLIFLIGYLFTLIYPELVAGNPSVLPSLKNNIIGIWLFVVGSLFLYISTYLDSKDFRKHSFLSIMLIWSGILPFLLGLILYRSETLEIQNIFAKLINPVSLFRSNDLFNGIESVGLMLRILIISILYQLIVSFRQNTRRK